jgi:hypothetical protein
VETLRRRRPTGIRRELSLMLAEGATAEVLDGLFY